MHTCLMVADEGDIYVLLDRFTSYDEESSGPGAKWDYFGVGGRWDGMFKLKRPRPIKKFFGLISTGEMTQTSVAKKCDIDQQALLAEPPAALFLDNILYECPMLAKGDALAQWKLEFKKLFETIPDERTLQIVDAHS